jgi:hypothetical protein
VSRACHVKATDAGAARRSYFFNSLCKKEIKFFSSHMRKKTHTREVTMAPTREGTVVSPSSTLNGGAVFRCLSFDQKIIMEK